MHHCDSDAGKTSCHVFVFSLHITQAKVSGCYKVDLQFQVQEFHYFIDYFEAGILFEKHSSH